MTLATFASCMFLILDNPFWSDLDRIGTATTCTLMTVIWLAKICTEYSRRRAYDPKMIKKAMK
eukprot:CAMPEP_0202039308 /NCGR_PEP_ID=MMETSP0962-20130828/15574_1 /ASSEMBLY_ACC=CAM_ASM_000488 /TAXON_ID=4773 /ORGANISM="Schizochytrium aggregatum, Strain ATCC28209" /LENGTH=62 /DNA_ID=CAMNT_0048603517 /DNA_START=62 /DNA_END=250 /DNA_ORIENTATION=+